MHAGQDFQQRRLAGAVLAEQAEDFAAAHVERDVAQRGDAGEMLGHAFDGEQHVALCWRNGFCCGQELLPDGSDIG